MRRRPVSMMTADSSWMPCTSQPSSTSFASSFCAGGRTAPHQPARLWHPPSRPRGGRNPGSGLSAPRRAAPRRAAVAAPGRARTAAAPRAAAAAAGRQPSALQRSPGPRVRETRPSQRTTRARAAAAAPRPGRRCRGRRGRPGGGSGSRRARLLGQRQDEATEAANLAALQPDVVAGRPEADHAAVAGRLHRAQRQALQAHPAYAAARQPPRSPGVSRQAL